MPLVQTEVVGFAEYHKIETLFERDKATFVVDPEKLKASVFGTIQEWDVTEKIDGTNIRVMLSEAGEVSFGGRTNAAQIPGDLVQYLIRTFQQDRLKDAMWIDGTPTEAILYGEGYGPGIQKGGGLYRTDKSFILFDVLVTTMVYNEVCPIHRNMAPSVTQIGHAMGGGFVNPVITKTGKKDILKPTQSSSDTNPSIASRTANASSSRPPNIGEAPQERSKSSMLSDDAISAPSSESVSRNTINSQEHNGADAQFAQENRRRVDGEEKYSRSSLTTATIPEECGAFYVAPATLESIKQNLIQDGWTPPRCTCVKSKWWLDREAVDDVARKVGIDVVPYLGRMTLDQIVEHVRRPFPSKLGTAMAEGVVARPIETLFDKKMSRVIIKLKTKDFVAGKR